MTTFYRFFAMLLLAVWLPMTSHCYLEESGLLNSSLFDDGCCAEESAAPIEDDPCETGCKMVENTGYKFQGDQKFSAPMLVCLLQLTPPVSLPISPASIEITSWPPERICLAQFDARTALPTRAPSFLS